MALTQVDQGLLGTYAQYTGFKNRLINGQMMIDQRNAGASVTPTVDPTYTLDRWRCGISVASKFSVQQSTNAPAGFVNSTLITSLSAYTAGSNEGFIFGQLIEGLNVSDLAWGTANAQPVTLSFWVRSSLTGTFGGSLRNGSAARSYPFAYTISSADTWEQKSITITGDTTGTWSTNTGIGINLAFSLGAGSTASGTAGAWASANYRSATGATSVVGTNGATFYITGVQLEKGSTATSFDYRPYGTELALCQRYYYKQQPSVAASFFGTGYNTSTTVAAAQISFPVALRAGPTAFEQGGTASDYRVVIAGSTVLCSSVPVYNAGDVWGSSVLFTVASGLTAGQGSAVRSTTTNAYLAWSAEL